MSDAYHEAVRRIRELQRLIEDDTVVDLEDRFLNGPTPSGEVVTFQHFTAPATAEGETSCDGFLSVVLTIG